VPSHRRRLVVLGRFVFRVEGVQVGALHVLPGVPGDRHVGVADGGGAARGFRVTQVVEVRRAVVGGEHRVPAVQAAVPRGDQGHRRVTSRQFLSRGRRPSVAMAAWHHQHVRPGRPLGPVSQHERVAVKHQVDQRGAVGRGDRPQIAGQTWHIGEHVDRPEPPGELSRRNHARDGPGRLVHQHPAPGRDSGPGPGGVSRRPVRPDGEGAIAVRPHAAHLELGERGAAALWVIDHGH